ncbi:MAG: peptide ligase PGM1-related protein, partial [Candidatus Nanopelagicales bacterium]
VGERLAAAGVTGRASIDFAAAREGAGRWAVYALEVNLRKGGTTHPYAALRNLVPGRYDPRAGTWVARDGSPRAYVCTDNLLDPSWIGMEPSAFFDAVTTGGCRFDHRTGTGVVLHMLSGLGIDGRIGLTAIAGTPDLAQALFGRACELVAGAAASRSL